MKNKTFFSLAFLCLVFIVSINLSCGSVTSSTTTTCSTSTSTSITATSSTSTSTTSSTTTTLLYPVSGTVQFYTAGQPGIKGGVTITGTNDSLTVVATTDSNTGTYEVFLPSGSYIFSATKETWDIPSITVEVTSEAAVNQHFIANPVHWRVIRVGTEPLKSIVQTSSKSGADLYLFAVGGNPAGNDGCVLRAAPPTYTTWESLNKPKDQEYALLYAKEYHNNGLHIIDRFGNQYTCNNADETTLTYSSALGALTIDYDNYYKIAFWNNDHANYGYTGKDTKKNYNNKPLATPGCATVEVSGNFYGASIYMDGNGIFVGEQGLICTIECNTNNASLFNFPTTETLTDIAFDPTPNIGGFITTSQGSIYRILNTSIILQEVAGIPYALTGAFSRPGSGPYAAGLVCGDNGLILMTRTQ